MDMYEYFKMLNEAVERNARERANSEASKDKSESDQTSRY